MGLVLLARIECVAQLPAKADGNEIALVRVAIVRDAKQSKLVLAQVEQSLRIQLVHLPVFVVFEQTVAVVGFKRNPFAFGWVLWCKSGCHVQVAIVAGEGDKVSHLRARQIGSREV